MANNSAQHQVEAWILKEGLVSLAEGPFVGRKVELKWGGMFAFDAVNGDGTIVGNISTSSARTAGNKLAMAKIQKNQVRYAISPLRKSHRL